MLEDGLDLRSDAALHDHVEYCPACQRRLERLTADAPPAPATSAPLGESRPLDAFLDRLKEDRQPCLPTATGAVESPRLAAAGFQVLGEVGRGGTCVVYLAREVRSQRQVALKLVRPELARRPEVRERFHREAMALARLDHPGIVRIYGVGMSSESRPYMALEYVGGGSLKWLLRDAPPSPEEAARLLEAVARAVHYAHSRGVVHRDLKPANILLSSSRSSEKSAGVVPGDDALFSEERLNEAVPKLTDFGLAKRLDGNAPPPRDKGAVLGTPSYMAPEQARGQGQEVGPAADVYALGAVLYELLTGRPPFQAAAPVDTLLAVLHDEPPPPSALQPAAPFELEAICLKCLRKQPHRRYASAAALAEDLRRWRDA
jgi:serine/threonine protein kinase